jgi:hypothetical protein
VLCIQHVTFQYTLRISMLHDMAQPALPATGISLTGEYHAHVHKKLAVGRQGTLSSAVPHTPV